MVTRSKFLFFLSIVLTSLGRTSLCVGDTIASGESLSWKVGQTLISNDGVFELGFFSPGTTSSNIYVGIWYKKIPMQTVVWVANRDTPLTKTNASSSYLILSEEGNLQLMESGTEVWSTNLNPEPGKSREAVLLDDGNFVLRDLSKSNTSSFLWQSFDYPTDTLLPSSKFGLNKITNKSHILTSWKGDEDAGHGMYSLHMEPYGAQLFLQWNKSQRYWSSGPWNGKIFSKAPEMVSNDVYNFRFILNEEETYFTYSVYNPSILSRIVIDMSGQIKQVAWNINYEQWDPFLAQPRQKCEVYGVCGAFGSCLEQDTIPCPCLDGFKPRFQPNQGLNNWYKGCERRTPLQCENKTSGTGQEDGFLLQSNIVLPANAQPLTVAGDQQCKLACLNNCSCTAYTYANGQCSIWYGELFNLQKFKNRSGNDLYFRLADSELRRIDYEAKTKAKKPIWWIVTIPTILAVIILCFFVCYMRKRKFKQSLNQFLHLQYHDSSYLYEAGERETSQDLLSFDLGTSTKANHGNDSDTSRLQKVEKQGSKLPLFSFSSVSAATNNFSAANKLGQGGFGPVYKGKLRDGHEVAVKRLSKQSGQGLTEFRNEMLLIAQLQHRNLVRLLGCCVEREEKILIYEYMPYKSLDYLLFDPKRQQLLDWERQVHIIMGISQGLIYLHQYSRLRIIHRDLKASNILLDGEMNPKISDFGMARIFGGNDSQANTNRIVGTYGYMSPEYAMEGLFSVKSDVFSFGVLMLEILSGKKNTGFYRHDSLYLLGYAWELWINGRGLELIDPALSDRPLAPLMLRYIQVALLCVQESPTERPTTPEVFSMLINESAYLPLPKEPAFSIGRREANANSGRGGPIHFSVNDVTITMEAR